MTRTIAAFRINILVYDPVDHVFSPDISIQRTTNVASQDLTLAEAKRHGIAPSEVWLKDYREWNSFHLNPNGFKGHPIFAKREDLYAFNDKGNELMARLQSEFPDHSKAKVDPFLPLYSNIEVGESVAAWWHLKDKNYGYVVPIQHMPISDELKSRLQLWRMHKTHDWLDPVHCKSFHREGHDLEEHILWELNVRMQDDDLVDTTAAVGGDVLNPKSLGGRQESVESVSMERVSMDAGH